jgi:hypothetical protein
MRYSYRVPPRIYRLFLVLDSCRWSGFVGAWCDLAADVVQWWDCWRVSDAEVRIGAPTFPNVGRRVPRGN